MLIRALAILLLSCVSVLAAPPVITAPAAVTIASGVTTAVKGISIAEPGASPLATYTVHLTDTVGLLSATGTSVSGSGTNSLIIGPVTLPNVTAALATLTFTGAIDKIDVTVTDSTSQIAVPAIVQVSAIDSTRRYLVYATQAAALTRSQAQCAVIGCDGTATKYWWNVIGQLAAGTSGTVAVVAGSYAVEVQLTGMFGTTVSVPACAIGCGLTPAEKATLVTATQLAPLLTTQLQ